jgi:transcriptional regulator with XRE-family HTH domain
VENFLRTRIQARLDDLGINPFEAARRSGGERTFINDLLIGKKDSIRRSAIPRVAEALDCDPEYLLGAQDAPRRIRRAAPEIAPDHVPLVGIAEAGTWRVTGRQTPPVPLPIQPDPRYPASSQIAYLVRGDHAASIGAGDGAVVVAVSGDGYRDGDVVVAVRTRDVGDGLEAETTIRRAVGGWLICDPETAGASRIPAESAEILARAISAHKTF